MPSSLISTVTRHQGHMPGDPADDAERLITLAEVLVRLPDPHRTRGRHYRLDALLVLCVTEGGEGLLPADCPQLLSGGETVATVDLGRRGADIRR